MSAAPPPNSVDTFPCSKVKDVDSLHCVCTSLNMASVCPVLYESGLFVTTEDEAYVFQQITLCVVSLISTISCLCWLHYRSNLARRGYVGRANGVFLLVYRRIIHIFIAVVSIQFLLRLCLIVLDVVSVALPSGVMFTICNSLLITLPDFMATLIAALFLKNTLSTRALHRALRISIPFSVIYCAFSIASYWNVMVSCISLMVLDVLLLLCCVLLVFRQCSYAPQWKRRVIISRLSA